MLSKFLTRKGTLWGALFFCISSSYAQDWKDLQWLRTVHYQKTLFGYVSEADDKNFFLSPEGKTSPQKELEAFEEALKLNDPDQKKNAYCRFPARVRWLRKFKEVPDTNVLCTDLEAFRKRIAAKSMSVVFSSYYLGNPASSFGHTFLRMGKKPYEEEKPNTHIELLDTGINYGALTEGAGPVVFAIGGLTGYFYGNYNAIPYYYKVREYNDYETRDLWSYQLQFSQEEVDYVVDHIWEMGHTLFQYYFLSENCSYHVMTILEAARPSLNLLEHLPHLYTIPSETLKALDREGLIKRITFRPAPSTVFYHEVAKLSSTEQKEMQDLFKTNTLPQTQDPSRRALIYDTALSLMDYKNAKKILKGDAEAQALKRPLLIGRSKIPVKSPDLDFSSMQKFAPHLGHGQKRLGVTGFSRDGKVYTDMEWRFAFHDLLDNNIGYPPKTTLEVVKFSARTDGHSYHLRDVDLVNATSLGAWDQYNHSRSWKIRLGQWQTRQKNRDLTTQGVLAGYGYSVKLGYFTPYALVHGESSFVSEKEHKAKFAYGSDVGFIVDFSESLKLQTGLDWRAYPWDESRFFSEARFSEKNYGFGAFHNSWLRDGVKDVGLRFFRYF